VIVPPKILLIGVTGQVGWELLRCLQPLGEVVTAGRQGHPQVPLDLTDLDAIRQVVRSVQPTMILNAAAYTAVDLAEQETARAQTINGTAPGILAEEAQRCQSILIHYSTDYVFDGQQQRPYTEQDPVNPRNVYGASKLAGEQAIQAVGGRYFILRTAWVYGLRGKNFLLTMQRLANERQELKIVADQWGAPTWSRLIAQATVQILAQLGSPLSHIEVANLAGIYHLTCGGQTSWYEFARAIVASQNTPPRVVPILTSQYPTPAQRPAYSVLSNAKLAATFGITLPSWERALELCVNA